ncbi:MAG: HAD-IIIC family phosphatase [Clostridium sp.]
MDNDRKIKCVVWDLDNTIWNGILVEDNNVLLKKGIVEIIKKLDERGILQSISSKNDFDLAFNKLKEFGIDEYFIYPQINWNPKSEAVKLIRESINIGEDTIAFIDDSEFERDEVKKAMPQVLCIDSADIDKILDMQEMNPRFITNDSKLRRKLYMNDIKRNKIQSEFNGTSEEFLRSLNMKLTISEVGEDDLKRVEELTVRTHQLNATGYTYSYEELDELRKSDNHIMLIAGLTDKYGTYGKIGLVLIECKEDIWTLKLLLMSCRVMSRGVGSTLLNYIVSIARQKKKKLYAEFVPTDRNRIMYITYKFAGFKEVSKDKETDILEYDGKQVPNLPDYIDIEFID